MFSGKNFIVAMMTHDFTKIQRTRFFFFCQLFTYVVVRRSFIHFVCRSENNVYVYVAKFKAR